MKEGREKSNTKNVTTPRPEVHPAPQRPIFKITKEDDSFEKAIDKLNRPVMKYLIYCSNILKFGERSFYTDNFDYDNHFNPLAGMIIFNLYDHKYSTDGKTWHEIQDDHL